MSNKRLKLDLDWSETGENKQFRIEKYDMDYLNNNELWNKPNTPIESMCAYLTNYPMYIPHAPWIAEFARLSPQDVYDMVKCNSVLDPKFIIVLAKYLPMPTVEYVCEKLFVEESNVNFVRTFYFNFFGAFLSRAYSWYSLKVLIRASVCRPELFDIAFQMLIYDVTLPADILYDFVTNINVNKLNNLMKCLITVNLNGVAFAHNVKTIHHIFIHSEKTNANMQYILQLLDIYRGYCYSNLDYGRLLHYFMENIEFRLDMSVVHLERLIGDHCTVYKNLCMTIFNNHMEVYRENFDRGINVLLKMMDKYKRTDTL